MPRGVCDISFVSHGDERGALVAIEGGKDLDFSIARVYYIFDTAKGMTRGKHAHKDLKQVLVCVHGDCDVLLDDGFERETVHLDDPSKGIYIYGYIWREMLNFSPDCVLMALVDHPYSREDYVFDYEKFRTEARAERQE